MKSNNINFENARILIKKWSNTLKKVLKTSVRIKRMRYICLFKLLDADLNNYNWKSTEEINFFFLNFY